jgi:hypothetical protein
VGNEIYKQFRKNPLWFNFLAFTAAQFTLAIFLCAYGIKERKSNTVISMVFFTLAVLFVFVSMQTAGLTY